MAFSKELKNEVVAKENNSHILDERIMSGELKKM